MTVSDLPVEGLRPWPGTSDYQFDSAGLTGSPQTGRCRRRILDQELKAATGLRTRGPLSMDVRRTARQLGHAPPAQADLPVATSVVVSALGVGMRRLEGEGGDDISGARSVVPASRHPVGTARARHGYASAEADVRGRNGAVRGADARR